MTIRLAHFSVRTRDLDASTRFFVSALGLRPGYRPNFPFPGVWLYAGGDEKEFGVVHLIGDDGSAGLSGYLGESKGTLNGTGAIDHIAFFASDPAKYRTRFSSLGLPRRERTVPDLQLLQIFVEDPSGVTIELNFHSDAASPGQDNAS